MLYITTRQPYSDAMKWDSPAKPPPRTQLELAANQAELVFLSLVQRGGVLPVAASVLHAEVQHRLVHVISQIVVPLSHLGGPRSPLAVEDAALQGQPIDFPAADQGGQIGAVDPGAQLVQRLGVPPAIHVGFAGRQVAAGQQSCIEALVVNLQIPRTAPADLYAGQGEDLSHFPGRGGGRSGSGGNSGGSGIRRLSGWLLRRAAVQTSS